MKKFTLALMIVLWGFLSACGRAPVAEQPAPDQEGVFPPTVDRAGNAIEIPDQVGTILALAPSIVQVVQDLGAGDRLIGVDTWSAFTIDGVGELAQIDMMAPDLELILALAPDLILASGIMFGLDQDIFQVIMDAGIAVAQIPTGTSLAEIQLDNQFIADAIGLHEEGLVLNEGMQAQIDEITAMAAMIENKKSVYFEISPLPELITFGTGTFLQEMLDLIHAENVFGNQEGWIPVTEEAAVLANPDVILTSVNFIPDAVHEILSRQGWSYVTAIQNGSVFYIDNETTNTPNHRVVIALREMALAIYPEYFAALGE